MSTSKDEQARQRLVEIALATVGATRCADPVHGTCGCDHWAIGLTDPSYVRERAGFCDPSKGSWCAAGLTAAMADAGLVVPAPGTPARRGAIALLDWVQDLKHSSLVADLRLQDALPGDIIAWKQRKPPQEWLGAHAFATQASAHSLCGKVHRMQRQKFRGERCSSCVWETRKGHVAVIVATDDDSITTVGWNEGPRPGRVMRRRLWRSDTKPCDECGGSGDIMRWMEHGTGIYECEVCRGRKALARPCSSTVPWRRPGGLAGIARPVAA